MQFPCTLTQQYEIQESVTKNYAITVHYLLSLMKCRGVMQEVITTYVHSALDLYVCDICVFSLCIGMFYYMLGNLRPELRSTQRSIQLLACVTSQNLEKYGFEAVLKPFIKDVNSLANVRV